MGYDQNVVRALYKKLLDLYPRAFRERFGESMEQTFNDLCKERGRHTAQRFVFVLSTFVETTIGMIKEHLRVISQGDTMRSILKSLGLSAIISFILVLPFMILEWANNRNRDQEFPIALFVFMWLLPMAFMLILIPIVRKSRAGNIKVSNPITLLLRVVFLVLIATVWGWGLSDQLPCFLGVPNCD